MQVDFKIADYRDPVHADAVFTLLNAYARDPMGGGEALADDVQQRLIATLIETPHAFSVLGWMKTESEEHSPVALANCLMGFSTFKAKPLINIHDCYVAPECRGQHVGQQLLHEIELIGRERNCCKITLEVLQGNVQAQGAYRKFGFAEYGLDPASGSAMFWEKAL
ncbi:GNAT family N-acetyltransferase [Alteromonas oceanisediminis]|uniref:GNAT family N-acetyltransferase n=1 Tax=Alteromonas oceanisediminis TaxID=2836180 RepID=UPI001BDA5FBD|nr:GNAT family N-acetyltransferase [Alteromonas oceanisediminis]MBT0586964.1 GNAT family N-acetyltransferase [Alteromonas oceanisediminis]